MPQNQTLTLTLEKVDFFFPVGVKKKKSLTASNVQLYGTGMPNTILSIKF